MKKQRLLLFLLVPILVVITSCSNIETTRIPFKDGFVNYYFFKNSKELNSNILIIFIGGSGPYSELGSKYHTSASKAHEFLKDKYDLLIPDKPNTRLGGKQSKNNKNMPYRISGYATAINSFLKSHSYTNIYLAGFSEGGTVVPDLYFKIKDQDKIKGLVIISSGGLSLYEEFKIASKNLGNDFPWKQDLNQIQKLLTKEHKTNKERLWLNYFTFSSLNVLKQVKVPILLLHGDKDTNSDIAGARIVKEEFDALRKSNLLYKEFKGYDHAFNQEWDLVFSEITNWIQSNQSIISTRNSAFEKN